MMNFKKISICFSAALVLSIALRLIQIVCFIEHSNGFYLRSKEFVGNALMVLIAVVCAAIMILSRKISEPYKPSAKMGWLQAVVSFAVAASLFCELFAEYMSVNMPAWQVLAVKLTTLLAAAYFVAFGIKLLLPFKMPSLLHVVPAFYAIVKSASAFINISSLALISDNILIVGAYCLLMLFFISYGKLFNGIEIEKTAKKSLSYGTAAAILCIAPSAAVLLNNIFTKAAYLHAQSSVLYSLFAMGLFVVVFVMTPAKKGEK